MIDSYLCAFTWMQENKGKDLFKEILKILFNIITYVDFLFPKKVWEEKDK